MKEFLRKKVLDKEEFLRDVHEAESYVYHHLKQDKDGIFSTEVHGASQNNLYVGNAGILHMYLQLNKIEPCEKYNRIIKEMTRYLYLHLFDGIEIAHREGEFVDGMAEAFYSGIGGIGLIFNEVYRMTQLPLAKKGAYKVWNYYLEQAIEDEAGCCWSDNAAIFFDGGITLFLIDYLKTFNEDEFRVKELIEKSCDHILKNAIRHEDGEMEIDHLKVDFKRREPNFEFGTAGIGYLFAKTYELTKNQKYLDASQAAAKYIKAIAVKQKKGYLVPYKLGVYDDLFYLGNCHGPVGTAKLFDVLYHITNDQSYLEDVFDLYEGAASLGAPFQQSPGFWNTTCICCGPAGYVSLFVGLYYETKDERWKELAHKTGEVLVGSKTRKMNLNEVESYWEIAFDRTKPNELSAPAGYFTGAAGIAVALLQIYCMESESIGIEGLIDDPYKKDEFIKKRNLSKA